MGMTIEPNCFVSIFRCCEDCSKRETCISTGYGYGCCDYKLYEAKGEVKDGNDDNDNTNE